MVDSELSKRSSGEGGMPLIMILWSMFLLTSPNN